MGIKEYSINKSGSVRTRILLAIALVQIPVIVLYYFILQNFIENFVAEQWSYQRAELLGYITNLQEELIAIDKYLYGKCYYILQEDDEESFLSEIIDASQELMENNNVLSAVSVTDKDGQTLYQLGLPAYGNISLAYPAKPEELPNGWKLYEYNGEYYLANTLETSQRRASVFVSTRQLASTASNIYHIHGTVLLQKNDDYINSTYWQRNAQEPIPEKISEPFILRSGIYRYMLSESTLLGMRVIYGCIYNYSFRWLYLFGYLLLGLAAVSAIITLLYLQRFIVKPLARMTSVIEKIGSGDIDLRVREEKSSEMRKISTTFNTMMDNLRDAKIESYEHQLRAKRAQIDALRLQIRRHFFLNCLKNIYAMASAGNLDGIKQTTYLLSSNLRYTLNFEVDSVPLEQELTMCEDYIKLQGVGQKLKPLLIIESAEELDQFRVPPVSLLTILENCCKYGLAQDHPLIIRIRTLVRQLDEERYAVITIQDNGPGYNGEMLELLNQDLDKVRENNHIGMANTLLRFRMLYGDECSALFSNSDGAKVELIIPMNETKEEVL